MSPTPRLHRIEQLLGARLEAGLSAAAIRHLVEDRVREDTDLDFKGTLYPQNDDGREELAKDVAAMANTRGGLIVLGVEERDEVAVAAPGVALDSDEEQRMLAIVKSRIRPLLPSFEILPLRGEDPSRGFFLLVVGVSELKPHLVVTGSSSKPRLAYPRRFGAQASGSAKPTSPTPTATDSTPPASSRTASTPCIARESAESGLRTLCGLPPPLRRTLLAACASPTQPWLPLTSGDMTSRRSYLPRLASPR
jgi:hypothetical protein